MRMLLRTLGAVTIGISLLLHPAAAVSLLSVTKTPYESFTCSIDFTALAGSDGIVLDAVIATNVQTGADATPVIVAASPVPAVVGSSDVVAFRVQGGANGQSYLIGARVADAMTGERFEGQITLVINSGR